jgi:hypothetical protein
MLEIVALLCSGLFAGAAIYVNLVSIPRASNAASRPRSPSSGRAIGAPR